MKNLFLMLSLLLLSASWTAAQTEQNDQSKSNSSPTTQETSADGQTTVQGCLSGSDGNYMLTDKDGISYQLTGDTAKLSEHVGHEIKVSGTTAGAKSSGDTSSGMGQNSASSQRTLEVSSVKHVAKTCQSTGTSR